MGSELAIAHMIYLLIMKITAFIIGYLIVKLGHDTLLKGITGDLDFGFSTKGVSTKLKSASPGAFFVLMGSAIIIWGITVDKTFYSKTSESLPPSQNTEQLNVKPKMPASEKQPSNELNEKPKMPIIK